MTDSDYALEFNFDSVFNISSWMDVLLETGYLVSGFKDKTYDKNIFNMQLIVRVFL
ncbi:hypothetical protein Dip510_000888 [Elusimicrobium posterum]|uniref:hypothetical protein n=1 Tax=Elusimicrobium posterum TaxID=3116653 RepID=UPI003C769353